MSRNTLKVHDLLKSYGAEKGQRSVPHTVTSPSMPNPTPGTLENIMRGGSTAPYLRETLPTVVWREGDYSLDTIESIQQLTETFTTARIYNAVTNNTVGINDHPTALLYFSTHRFFRLLSGEAIHAIIIVDYLRCLRVSTKRTLRPDDPHLPAICKAIAALKAIPSPSPQHEIRYVVGLPHSPFANTALLDDGRYVPIADAPVGQILRAKVFAVDLPAEAVYALLASPNVKVHIGGVPQSFLDNLPTHIAATLVIGNPSTPPITRVQSLGGLYLQEDAQADFPNLTSLDYLAYEGTPDHVSLPGVTTLDTFYNREHEERIDLPNISAIGNLLCNADDIHCPGLRAVRRAELTGKRIHLPALYSADIIVIHDCPTVVLPSLAGVETLTLPNTKVFIAPRVCRIGWWNDFTFDTVVSGPAYEHHSFQNADHHVMS